MMKFSITLFILAISYVGIHAQTLEVKLPSGLEYPYEVNPGTAVTFQLDQVPTAFFTNSSEPVFPDFGTDPAWQQHTFIDNGDGTSSYTQTINTKVYVWAGTFSDFLNRWDYTNVIEVTPLSGVNITAVDKLLCNTGSDTETLSVAGTYDSYQWYFNNVTIDGATAQTYQAAEEGYYKVKVIDQGTEKFSNTINIKYASINMSAAYNATSHELTLTASPSMQSYQWLAGPDEGSLAEISGATTQEYIATLSNDLVYYSVKALIAGCEIQTTARAASLPKFTAPVITKTANANAYNIICPGSLVTLSIPDEFENYEWFRNGEPIFYSFTPVLELTSEDGSYHVTSSPLGWPEITLTSSPVNVDYYEMIIPALTGISGSDYYCPNQQMTVVLSDEGYTYKWYLHQSYNYTDTDEVTVAGTTYNFQFTGSTFITVKGEVFGCSSETTIPLKSYEEKGFFIQPSNGESPSYLCPGNPVGLMVSQDEQATYQNYQWYSVSASSETPITGETSVSFNAASTGVYKVSANPVACPAVTVYSYPLEIFDYLKRDFYLTPSATELCQGEEATLTAENEWTNVQWFTREFIITSTGYSETYVPVTGSGNSLAVNKFKAYVAKAKHSSCESGLKITSHPVYIRPKVNPDITPSKNNVIQKYHKTPYDSAANYLYCVGEDLGLSVPDEFTSYQWYTLPYNGDSGYDLGTAITGGTTASVNIVADGADWYTLQVEDATGCIGFSDPVLIDTRVHNAPVITSRDNAELCVQGDSTLLNLTFQSADWIRFEWLRDGELVENSDNDSIYAKVPGEYILIAYTRDCPDIPYSSGTGPVVSFFPQATIEENDTVLYAMPEVGFYYYQWYLDGVEIDPEEPAWVRYKSNLQSGAYTVKVANPKDCQSTSEPFLYTITSVEDSKENLLEVYPNPGSGVFNLTEDKDQVESLYIITQQGQRNKVHLKNLQVDLTNYPAGVYVVEAVMKNGINKKVKIIRH